MAARTPDLSRAGANWLLAALPAADRDRLLARADEATFEGADLVYRAHWHVRHVYFPVAGILSMVIDTEDGGTVEVGTVGREGMVGLPAFLGADRSPVRVYCQLPPCVTVRVPADHFCAEVARGGPLQDVAHKYTQYLMNQMAQSIACGRLHPVEQRLARWLLMTRDRVDDEVFPLTQQILAEMLGVRRPSVTVAAGILSQAGLIQYTRGRITVLDRAGLEAAACECYAIVRGERDRLLKPPGRAK